MKYLIGLSLGLILILFSMLIGYVIRDKNIITSKPDTPINVQLDSFKIYNLINDYRAKNNLPRLAWNPTVCDYSNTRLKQIHIDYSHNGYEQIPPSYLNIPGSFIGENLAPNEGNEQKTVTAWINSQEHLSNIVNPRFTQTCIASDIEYAVQEFSSTF